MTIIFIYKAMVTEYHNEGGKGIMDTKVTCQHFAGVAESLGLCFCWTTGSFAVSRSSRACLALRVSRVFDGLG